MTEVDPPRQRPTGAHGMAAAETSATSAGAPAEASIAVWDLPTRLSHWILTVAVGVCLVTGLTGGFGIMDWHKRSGYVVLAALLFRVMWGFVGSRYARFASFLYGPRRIASYARAAVQGHPPPMAGHNPLGGWMTVILLVALATQASAGLFASDDFMTEGPLVYYVSDATSNQATAIHHLWKWVVGALVALHIGALAVHRLAWGERLVGAMVTGRKTGPPGAISHDGHRPIMAVIVAGAAAWAIWMLVTF